MAQVLGDQLTQPPADGITRVRFSTPGDLLLASSWDGATHLYGPDGSKRARFQHSGPVLDCCFQQDVACYSGGLDGSVTRVDVATGAQQRIGQHMEGTRCVEWLETLGLLMTASWDGTLRYWDLRMAPGQCNVATAQLPGRAYTLSSSTTHVVVGTSERHVYIYHTRNLTEPEQKRESSLKYQTRCIAAFPDDTGYALGSVEGRMAMEYFDPSPAAQAAKYAFKCHRKEDKATGTTVVYPINAVAFHKPYGTFATGGSDGVVSIWDGANKKRLFQISQYPSGVASLAFSGDGSRLAVASSYMFEQGDIDHPADAIFIRQMADAEVKAKPRVAK